MGTAFGGMNVVNKGEGVVVIAIVVLQGNLNIYAVLHAFCVHDLVVEGIFVLVGVSYEFADTAFVVEFLFLFAAFAKILQGNVQTLGQESSFTQTGHQGVEVVVNFFENGVVGQEGHVGTGLIGITNYGQRLNGFAAFKDDLVDLTAAVNLYLNPIGQGIYNRGTYAVQTTGYFVSAAAEFTAGMQNGINNFYTGDALLGLNINRDTTAVIGNGNRIIGINSNSNFVAVAGKGLIYRVVYDLIYQVVQTAGRGAADIHTGTTAYSFQTFQDLDLACGILAGNGNVVLDGLTFAVIVGSLGFFSLLCRVGS